MFYEVTLLMTYINSIGERAFTVNKQSVEN